jgi:RHS repeat-associated protein
MRAWGGPGVGTQPTGDDYTATNYTYTPAGQQAVVESPDKATWTYTYDLFGRQTSATDPDKGKATTAYDELDQAITTTDSRGKTLVTEYDALGRRTGLWDGTKTDASKLAAWTFDTLAKGQQDTAVRYENGINQTASKAYTQKVTSYDPLYRPTGTSLTLPDGDPLVTAGVPKVLSGSTTYNADGTVMTAASPAVGGLPSETVRFTYGALGQMQTSVGMVSYARTAMYSPQGDLRQLHLGNSETAKAVLTYLYEPGTRRLTESSVTDTIHSYPAQDLRFTQDAAGNVTSIFDATTQGGTAKPDYQCFTYDGHRRLKDAWTPKTPDCATAPATAGLDGAAPYWTTYGYNTAGQRTTETEHTTSGDKTTTYTYGTATAQPHPLAKTTGAKNATYAHDKAGNTTSRPGTQAQQTLTWNTEGELVGTTEPAAGTKPALGTSYLYDASGELLIRRATGDGDTVLYLGGTEVRLTTKGTTKTLSGTRYYSAAGQTIALRTATAGVTGTKLSFLAADHHGTSSVALDATTLAVTKRYTTPFGAPRGAAPTAWPDDKAFLGKPADKSTGLTHIGAREYDPAIGQFISVDPLLALDQHQSLNGYVYANNNPTTHADPTGLYTWEGDNSPYFDTGGTGGTSTVGNAPGNDRPDGAHAGCDGYGCGGGGAPTSGETSGTASGNSGASKPQCYYAMGLNHCETGANAVATDSSSSSGNYSPRVNVPGGYPAGDPRMSGQCSGWTCVAVYGMGALFAAVVLAPVVMAVGPELTAVCLANPAGCAEVAAEIGTGGAAGGSLVGNLSRTPSRFTSGFKDEFKTPESVHLKKLINPKVGDENCRACAISVDQLLAGNGASSARPDIGRGSLESVQAYYPGKKFRDTNFSWIVKTMRQAGPGARGIVYGADAQGGHVFNVVNQRGTVVFLDGQRNSASHADTWDGYKLMRTN